MPILSLKSTITLNYAGKPIQLIGVQNTASLGVASVSNGAALQGVENVAALGTVTVFTEVLATPEAIINVVQFGQVSVDKHEIYPDGILNSTTVGGLDNIQQFFTLKPNGHHNESIVGGVRAINAFVRTGLEFAVYRAIIGELDVSDALLSISVQMTQDNASANITLMAIDEVVSHLTTDAQTELFLDYQINGRLVHSQPLFSGNLSSFTLYRGPTSASVTATIKGGAMDYGGTVIKLDSVETLSTTGGEIQFNLFADKGIMIGDLLDYENARYQVNAVTLSISPELKRLTVKAL